MSKTGRQFSAVWKGGDKSRHFEGRDERIPRLALNATGGLAAFCVALGPSRTCGMADVGARAESGHSDRPRRVATGLPYCRTEGSICPRAVHGRTLEPLPRRLATGPHSPKAGAGPLLAGMDQTGTDPHHKAPELDEP